MQDISDCLSLEAQNVAEARLAAKRAARAEAREIRMKELERQQKEADEDDAMSVTSRSSIRVEERSDKDFGEKGGRPVSSLSAATLASLGGTSSRRGSGDTSISVDTEASIREIKDSLAEVEEKYKRSMVTNAQLDNEKSSLQYQVDTLREVLLELEEELAESRRQYEDKHKECERHKHDQNVLRFQLAEMKDALEQRETLLTKNGIALDSVDTPNGDTSVEPQVNTDGRPDPPVRTTSMGKSYEAEKKPEVMSVMGESPPSQTKQDEQKVLQDTSSEKPLHAVTTDIVKEQGKDQTDSNLNEKVEHGEINVDHQEEGLHHGLEAEMIENEMDVEKSTHKNLTKEVVENNFSETDGKAALNLRDARPVSPIETEVFQDALDDVVQSPSATSELRDDCPVSLADCTKENIHQQEDFTKEEGKCELQCTAVKDDIDAKDIALEISEQKVHKAGDNSVNTSEILSCREHEKICFSDPITVGSEESSGEGPMITYDQPEALTKKELEKHPVPDGSGPQDSEHNSGETQIDNMSDSTTVGIEADIKDTDTFTPDKIPQETSLTKVEDIQADIDDADENKLGSTPEQSSQDTPLTKEEQHPLETEDRKSHEVPESSLLVTGEIPAENEMVKDNIVMENNRQVQNENITGVGSLDTNTEKSQEIKNLETTSLDAAGTELLDQGKVNQICDHLVCDENQEIIKNIQIFDETPKEPVRDERLSSEAESTTEREESDENEDNDDDGTERSEKYIGESLGSSVDQTSMDDIRMEDGSDKSARKGKGKNKEDCVLS